MKWWDQMSWSSFFECWVQESRTGLIHNEAEGALGSFYPPASTRGNFPFKWGVRGRKIPPPVFLRASVFWILSPCRSHFLSFLPRGPCQLLLCSLGYLQPGLGLSKHRSTRHFFLSRHHSLSSHQHRCFWSWGWGSQQTLPEPFPTSLTAPRRCPSSKSPSKKRWGFSSSSPGFSLQSTDYLSDLFLILTCCVEMCLSSWCWGAWARSCSGERNKCSRKQFKGFHACGMC